MKKLLWFLVLFIPTTCYSQVIQVQQTNPALDWENAVSAHLDNKLKKVETFWQLQDIYKERQEEKFKEIQRKRQFYLSLHGLNDATEDEFNQATGTINWLRTFRQPIYTEYVDIYERILKKHAQYGLDIYEYEEIRQTSKKFRELIATHKKYYPDQIVNDMIRFILKLDRELNKA